MRISFENLKVNNYRYYYGEQELTFSRDPKRNVIVIKGDNGAGKSNLLNALTWCLYNDEVHIDKKSDNLPIMNTQYIAELADGRRTGEATVQLTLDVEGSMWEITRKIEGYCERDPTWTKDEPKYTFHESFRGLQVRFVSGEDYKIETGETAQNMIWELLPPDLRSFFFIDGEQLHEFFKKDSSRKMRESIEKLSQLELIESTVCSLETYRSYLRKKKSECSPKAEQQIQVKLDEAEKRKRKFLNDKDALIQKRDALLDQKKEIDVYLENYNLSEIKSLSTRINMLEKQIEREKSAYEKYQKDKTNLLISMAPIIYMKDDLCGAYDVIDKLIERGTLPPMIRESFIHQLIKKGTCLCGSKITPEIQKTLEDYALNIQISEMDSIAHEGKLEIEKCFAAIKAFPEELANINDKIEDSEQVITNLETEKRTLSEEREGYNIQEINEKTEERDKLSRDAGSCERMIKIADVKIDEANREIKNLQIEEEREKSKNTAHSEYSDKLDLVNTTLTILGNVISRVKETIRLSLEENTKKYFLSFLREEGRFRDVRINGSYEVQVINNEGWNNLGGLSAGQYLILGYAFVVALRTITGYQAPVIVDTPLGKLDSIHQDKITKNLPHLLKDTQLVFLVTSSEYTDVVKKNFAEYMGENSEYVIEKLEGKTSARLVNVQ